MVGVDDPILGGLLVVNCGVVWVRLFKLYQERINLLWHLSVHVSVINLWTLLIPEWLPVDNIVTAMWS
jgi:hypothetical protein